VGNLGSTSILLPAIFPLYIKKHILKKILKKHIL